ncbi:MAG: SMC-Scp complex subunit ScpB [Bacilli bacterium]|nr:SMC-Scp complex subunit ScpB [Bacilli bacterium]
MLQGILEGLLFVVGEDGLSIEKAKELLEIDDQKLNEVINELKMSYENETRGLSLTVFGNYLRLTTKKEHKMYYEALIEIEDEGLLSQASLETLAIIAYNQPVTRVKVDEIRGINSSHIIRKLLSKNLIKDIGRADTAGKPILYEVTKDFLDYFGLDNIDKLPKIEEIDDKEDLEMNLYESKYKEN